MVIQQAPSFPSPPPTFVNFHVTQKALKEVAYYFPPLLPPNICYLVSSIIANTLSTIPWDMSQ